MSAHPSEHEKEPHTKDEHAKKSPEPAKVEQLSDAAKHQPVIPRHPKISPMLQRLGISETSMWGAMTLDTAAQDADRHEHDEHKDETDETAKDGSGKKEGEKKAIEDLNRKQKDSKDDEKNKQDEKQEKAKKEEKGAAKDEKKKAA